MLPAHVRILLCTEPQDFRRSFDGLALAARQVVGEDPQSGAIFAYFNKRMNRLKLLWWDESGYCLLYKRLHEARVELPSSALGGRRSVQIDGAALAALLRGAPRTKRTGVRRKAA
jgi:transposase